jgi:hypothetical protein
VLQKSVRDAAEQHRFDACQAATSNDDGSRIHVVGTFEDGLPDRRALPSRASLCVKSRLASAVGAHLSAFVRSLLARPVDLLEVERADAEARACPGEDFQKPVPHSEDDRRLTGEQLSSEVDRRV